jgi:signal transduction histidine kinase
MCHGAAHRHQLGEEAADLPRFHGLACRVSPGAAPHGRADAERVFTSWRVPGPSPSAAVLGSIAVSDSDSAADVIQAYAHLLSLAVHEFRTPATVVGGYLRMLQKDVQPPLHERQKKMVDEAAKSTARIVEIIAEMSDIAKLDSGDVAIRQEPFDLFTLVGEVAATVHEAEDRGVRLQVQGESAGATIAGDVTRVRAAISAFLRAVLREQPSAGVVVADRRLVREAGGHSAVVAIASEQAVQQSYGSPRRALEEKRSGLGLALPLARRVVERHGGAVWSPSGGSDSDSRGAILFSVPLSELSR